MPTFVFMTGASQYRCQANSREEVLKIARDALQPTPEAMSVIESTLYVEDEGKQFEAQPSSKIDSSIPSQKVAVMARALPRPRT
jgi:hypothetical protein